MAEDFEFFGFAKALALRTIREPSTWTLARCNLPRIGSLVNVAERGIELEVTLGSLSFVVQDKWRVYVPKSFPADFLEILVILHVLNTLITNTVFRAKSKEIDNQILSVFIRGVFEFQAFETSYVIERINSCFSNEGGLALQHLKHNNAERPQITRIRHVCIGDGLGSDVLLRADQTVVSTHIAVTLVFKDRRIAVLRFANLAIKVFVKDLASCKVNQLQMVMFV